ncbi:MAG: GAF domain-containing protein [Deltaproteobacteria bacterium]|nr:GAF domain-containing protein [Deltaproteobacteria bacterium]MBW2015686.1 GAF domain-containing protein [Deltaproteobacteria bacterium]
MTQRTKLLLSHLFILFLAVSPFLLLVRFSFLEVRKPLLFYFFLGLDGLFILWISRTLARYFARETKQRTLALLAAIEQGGLERKRKREKNGEGSIEKSGARISRRLREDEQKLRILFEISSFVSSLLHLDQVLDAIVSLLMKEFRLDACAILLLSEDGILKIKSQRGLDKAGLRESNQKPSLSTPSGECFLTGRIIIVNDTEKTDRDLAVRLAEGGEVGSFAVTPIIVEGSTIGVLGTYSKKKNYFHPRFNDVISTIANQAGIAIRISRVYGETYASTQALEEKVRERTKKLEERTRQLIEAEKQASQGRMANRVAHELRNSLTVVGGFSRRLYERTPDDDPRKTYLGIIVEEVKLLEKKVSAIIRNQDLDE